MSNVLVLDEGSRPAIAVVRSLGRKGINVTIATERGEKTPASLSKYVSKRIPYYPYESSSDIFVKRLIANLKENAYDMVIPIGEGTTGMVSKYKDILLQYTNIPVPDHDTWIKAKDKAQTLKVAMDLGIPCPITYFNEVMDVNEIEEDFKFPLIIKPRMSYGSLGITYVNTPDEFMNKYNEVRKLFGIPLVQEYIPQGYGGYGVSMLFNNGKHRAIFAHKRLREYPITGGPSTLRESIRLEAIEEYATKILKTLNWHGIAMVEFRGDPRDMKFKLMEINPRFWGSLPLAIYAGVDFPHLLYNMCIDGDIKPVFNYRIGVRARWLAGDILWLLSYPNKLKAFIEFLKPEKDTCFDLVSLDDPKPAIGEIISGLWSLTNRDRRLQMFNRGMKR